MNCRRTRCDVRCPECHERYWHRACRQERVCSECTEPAAELAATAEAAESKMDDSRPALSGEQKHDIEAEESEHDEMLPGEH